MLGDGAGMLEVVRGAEYDLTIHGEQRGSAVSDFNLNGRVDLVVTQNGALTRLYRNREAKPGLRVKVNACPANPTGVRAPRAPNDPSPPDPAIGHKIRPPKSSATRSLFNTLRSADPMARSPESQWKKRLRKSWLSGTRKRWPVKLIQKSEVQAGDQAVKYLGPGSGGVLLGLQEFQDDAALGGGGAAA